MGTRGCYGFRYKGKDYLTYNHFDSYPEGLGKEILEEISGTIDWEKVKKNVENLTLVDDDTPPTKEEIEMYERFGNPGVGELSTNTEIHTWYQLLRNLQGNIASYLNGSVKHMINSNDFLADSLFCEWAYIINLDTIKFEVFVGYQHTEDLFNRYGTEPNKEGYYPCKLIKTYSLNNLPDIELFEHNFKYDEDEEEYTHVDDDEVPYKPEFEAIPCCECGCTVGYIDSSAYDSSFAIYCKDCKEGKE